MHKTRIYGSTLLAIAIGLLIGCASDSQPTTSTASEVSSATAPDGAPFMTTNVTEHISEDEELSATAPDGAPFMTTDSGLKYRILRESEGIKPTETSTVTVHYRGWLDNGTEFDSSYKHGKPATFQLKRVVRGWTEGLQLVGVGGIIELEIPSYLGYGTRGGGGVIPPNATLHFTVELIEVK